MRHTINNRFTLSSDNSNWILIDKESAKEKRYYFTNLDQLSKFVVELKAKDSLIKGEAYLVDINNLTLTYDAVTSKISQDLIRYFLDITNGMSYQEFYRCDNNEQEKTA